ncbi:prepilin-type N-terminal cleavage/methylation domain-containing protein [Enterococcus casseliflavus]|uniref:prepilin-type N-terminal cleavage/methylation domain-containing protein n=1 Tax=Enterococcus casseliflavus TaxID=37734 RepID=UPI0037C798CE
MIDAILAEETTDNRLNKLLKDERGLSLVELLAVVVILAIIAGIGVIAIGNVIQNTREDSVVSEIQQAFSAGVLYQSTNHELNNNSSADIEFTLEDVMEDGLLNSDSWVENTESTVMFYIDTDGALSMFVPEEVLEAGQKKNNAIGEADNGYTQTEINSLTRDDVFGTPTS